MYLYQFEDGSIGVGEDGPTKHDLVAVDAGILCVYHLDGCVVVDEIDSNGDFIRAPTVERQAFEGQDYTVIADAS